MAAIAETQCMQPLKKAMQARKDMTAVACEALSRLFSTSQDQLVKQALEVDFIQFLLNLLEERLELIDNPAMTKAQIVKALKSMTRSLLYGDRVAAVLEKSAIWAEYKDQKHDLFITSSNVSGYLTGRLWGSLKGLVYLVFGCRYPSSCRLFDSGIGKFSSGCTSSGA